jgi:hypothetical protein
MFIAVYQALDRLRRMEMVIDWENATEGNLADLARARAAVAEAKAHPECVRYGARYWDRATRRRTTVVYGGSA